MADVQIDGGDAPAEIQRKILAAYEAHGVEPLTDFSRQARFIAAGKARAGTKTPRLLWELGSGLLAARRFVKNIPETRDDGDQAGSAGL